MSNKPISKAAPEVGQKYLSDLRKLFATTETESQRQARSLDRRLSYRRYWQRVNRLAIRAGRVSV